MAARQNCWEAKGCGRQPGGAKAVDLGVCPAATAMAMNRLNGGLNGGRLCWAVAGTLCGGKVQGTYAQKLTACSGCEFYRSVRREEGTAFRLLATG